MNAQLEGHSVECMYLWQRCLGVLTTIVKPSTNTYTSDFPDVVHVAWLI